MALTGPAVQREKNDAYQSGRRHEAARLRPLLERCLANLEHCGRQHSLDNAQLGSTIKAIRGELGKSDESPPNKAEERAMEDQERLEIFAAFALAGLLARGKYELEDQSERAFKYARAMVRQVKIEEAKEGGTRDPQSDNRALEVRAARIVQALQEDMADRRGFRQNWDSIDHDTRNEIVEAWLAIVRETLSAEISAP